MCLLIMVPHQEESKLPIEFLEASIESGNNDGLGIAYWNRKKDKMVIWRSEKSTPTTLANLYELYEGAALKKYPTLIHLRAASRGTVSLENTHPFIVGHDIILAHNGTLRDYEVKKARANEPAHPSDTLQFAKTLNYLFDALGTEATYKALFDQDTKEFESLHRLLSGYCGTGNKLGFLGRDGSWSIVNSTQGTWKDGIWYSNESYNYNKWKYAYHGFHPDWEDEDFWGRLQTPADKTEGVKTDLYKRGSLMSDDFIFSLPPINLTNEQVPLQNLQYSQIWWRDIIQPALANSFGDHCCSYFTYNAVDIMRQFVRLRYNEDITEDVLLCRCCLHRLQIPKNDYSVSPTFDALVVYPLSQTELREAYADIKDYTPPSCHLCGIEPFYQLSFVKPRENVRPGEPTHHVQKVYKYITPDNEEYQQLTREGYYPTIDWISAFAMCKEERTKEILKDQKTESEQEEEKDTTTQDYELLPPNLDLDLEGRLVLSDYYTNAMKHPCRCFSTCTAQDEYEYITVLDPLCLEDHSSIYNDLGVSTIYLATEGWFEEHKYEGL